MKSRIAVLFVVLVLCLAGCGARLTREQRLAGIGSLTEEGGSGTGTDTGTGTDPGTGTGTGTGAGTGTGTGAGTGSGAGAGAGASGCTTNAGATDKGVTATQVTIATASDVSGVQAALFKTTHQAMQALVAYQNSLGGVCRRALKWLPLDTKAESGANRAAVQQACNEAFALVGSMSAFDNGGAEVGAECGIPDLTAITVNGSRALAKNVRAINPVRPDKFLIGTGNYIKSKYPQVIQSAAMLYLNAGVTKSNALQRVEAYESIGFQFDYIQEVQVLEANYSPFVQEMKDRGIKYVSMVANYQSIVRLLKAMDQAEWYPEVRDWDSVAYSSGFLAGGSPTEGSFVFVNTAISEEASSNPEMQLYIQWLNRVAPGAKPDFFGFYAWSAGRLFVKVAQTLGPTLKRTDFLAEVTKIRSWDGNGLHAAHDVGGKLQSPCFMYLDVKGGKFVRKDPPSGFICNMGNIINT